MLSISTVGGDFSYNDAANDFICASIRYTYSFRNANIVAADFANSGTITATALTANIGQYRVLQ